VRCAAAQSTRIDQFLTHRPYSISLAVIGTGAWLALWMITLAVATGE
jgi:hypothetical protein